MGEEIKCSLEVEILQRWEMSVKEISPNLHAAGRIAACSAFGGLGASVVGASLGARRTLDLVDRIVIPPGSTGIGDDREKLLKSYVKPVLEPFIVGLNEPLKESAPMIAGIAA